MHCTRPMKHSLSLLSIVSCASFAWVNFVNAQGILTPPGSPAPTMKSLDQVEPRIVVDASHTPGDSNSLFKITQPGSYFLTTNLTGVSGKHGISIESSAVTLDLNGFTLSGVAGSFNGINITNAIVTGITVRNGAIRNWGKDGVSASASGGGFGEIFSDLHLLNNGAAGLSVLRALVVHCDAQSQFSGPGIQAYESRVLNCVVTGNQTGIAAFAGTSVEGCAGKFNGTGIDAGAGSSVVNCNIQASGGSGIFLREKSRLTGNIVSDGSAAGIFCAGTNNVIEANQIINNAGAGLSLTNVGVMGNLILRNTARGNGTNYLMGTGNSFGPVVNVNGVGDISAVPNANHPWANFSY